MGPRLKLLVGAMIVTIFGSLVSFETVSAKDGETYFVATAYYSPLPGQSRYTTGSYAGDIRLNGEGHTTASGKDVFPGLLAGPKNYPFGTKIYFQGIGIGVVEDRGGAIVKAGERGHSYDRIDIWMGYGDEGLQRALSWGTRTIKGKIVVPSASLSISFGESSIGNLTKLSVNPQTSKSDDVKQLQTIFTKADLYSGEIDGKYQSIRNELIDFQLSTGVIKTKSEESAGWYGPKTIAALRETYGGSEVILIEESSSKFNSFNHKVASEKYKVILEYGNLQVEPSSPSQEVVKLQELLTELGEYSGKIDGKYSSIESSLLSLQKKIGLIDNSESWGAGYFGNKTKSALWTYYEKNDSSITTSYSLSSSEKFKLSQAFSKLQSKHSEAYVTKLLEQIDSILPRFDNNSVVKAKILYLKEIAQ